MWERHVDSPVDRHVLAEVKNDGDLCVGSLRV
jgi:hypothetical protein